MSVCFSFEVPGSHLEKLGEALAAIGVNLTNESVDSLARLTDRDAPYPDGSEGPDIAGTLQITFIHNEPDLRIEIPQIPG